jgi:hypothetical protein
MISSAIKIAPLDHFPTVIVCLTTALFKEQFHAQVTNLSITNFKDLHVSQVPNNLIIIPKGRSPVPRLGISQGI